MEPDFGTNCLVSALVSLAGTYGLTEDHKEEASTRRQPWRDFHFVDWCPMSRRVAHYYKGLSMTHNPAKMQEADS
jgi:hypothetical protein